MTREIVSSDETGRRMTGIRALRMRGRSSRPACVVWSHAVAAAAVAAAVAIAAAGSCDAARLHVCSGRGVSSDIVGLWHEVLTLQVL